MNRKYRKTFLIILSVFHLVVLCGCTTEQQEETELGSAVTAEVQEETAIAEEEKFLQEILGKSDEKLEAEQAKTIAEYREIYLAIGKELKNLENLPGMDKTVILVEGYPITRKQVETAKIYCNHLMESTIKEAIDGLIWKVAIKAEADRLGVQPSKERMDEHREVQKQSLQEDNPWAEIEFALMDGFGITEEEYLQMGEEDAYDMFQREALWLSSEAHQRGEDYDQFMDEIAENAKVEILDEEIEKLLNE